MQVNEKVIREALAPWWKKVCDIADMPGIPASIAGDELVAIVASLADPRPGTGDASGVQALADSVRMSRSRHAGTYESSSFEFYPAGPVDQLLSALSASPAATRGIDDAPVDPRKAFEAANRGMPMDWIDGLTSGYRDPHTQERWLGWKACWKRVETLTYALDQMRGPLSTAALVARAEKAEALTMPAVPDEAPPVPPAPADGEAVQTLLEDIRSALDDYYNLAISSRGKRLHRAAWTALDTIADTQEVAQSPVAVAWRYRYRGSVNVTPDEAFAREQGTHVEPLYATPPAARSEPAAEMGRRVVKAWEALPGGMCHGPGDIQRWLVHDMKPAMDSLRAALATPEAPYAQEETP